MSEVDRLSHSGLYPALPIADKRGKDPSAGDPRPHDQAAPPPPPRKADEPSATKAPRPPKSIIDDYA